MHVLRLVPGPMTKSELIEKVVRNRKLPPDMTKKRVSEILDVAFEELAAYFVRAKITRRTSPRFTFPGFGTFTKKRRSARNGVNPRTLEPMVIDAQLTLDFKAGSKMREAMNPPRGPSKQRRPQNGASTATRDRMLPPSSPKTEGSLRDEAGGGPRRLRSREEAELDTTEERPNLPPPRMSRIDKTRRSSALPRSG
ncbi:MAG: HU family DNA-binding protein [Nannocystaceae bacterium]